MLFYLSDQCRKSQKIFSKSNIYTPYRSHSHEQILSKSNHRRSNSNHSIDLFKINIPTSNDSSFSSLVCSICSLPMIKPTLLPCQHTFCYKCLQNIQQIRPGSLPNQSTSNCLLNDRNYTKILTCQKCHRIHRLNSLTELEENQSIELLINTLLCETCQQLCPFNQLDTCLHCFAVLCPECYDIHRENHQNDFHNQRNTSINESTLQTSDSQIFQPRSINNEIKSLEEETNTQLNLESSQNNHQKKKSLSFRTLFRPPSRKNSSSESSSSIKSKQSKLRRRHAQDIPPIELDQIPQNDISSSSSPVPITPLSRFRNLHEQYALTVQHIQQSKQRQIELNYSVDKLIEVITMKTNETIQQISSYWIYLKEILLERLQSMNKHFPLIDYFFKTCCSTNNSRKIFQTYFEQNDDINAAIDILLTTFQIIDHQQISLLINQLFYREEQLTIRGLQRQLEHLLASYREELSFIIERIRVYETRFSSWKNTNELDSIAYEWTQIIEHDYPTLIEKLANDFITKIPKLDQILLQMLRNIKKKLLSPNQQESIRRTSNS